MSETVKLDLRFEEDIEQAVAIVTRTMGPQGRMLPSAKNVSHNMRIVDNRMNILWYGDTNSADAQKLQKLSSVLATELVLQRM